MKFQKTLFEGLWVIEPEKREDERGYFARIWCRDEFKKYGINFNPSQTSISFNEKKGTLRGMHFQKSPFFEAKVISCVRGAIYDVVIDLRSTSPTFKKWFSIELNDENHNLLYVSEGFAHGFQTLEDKTEVFYYINVPHVPDLSSGVRWDDPAFGIKWPEVKERIISEKDQNWPELKENLKEPLHAAF